jgi:hypothetical protein
MSSGHIYVANILSALLWAPIHVLPGVLLGLAITLGDAHAPQLSLAAVGVLILRIAWSLIRRKAAAVLKSAASQQAPASVHAHLPRDPLIRQTALGSQIAREIGKLPELLGEPLRNSAFDDPVSHQNRIVALQP